MSSDLIVDLKIYTWIIVIISLSMVAAGVLFSVWKYVEYKRMKSDLDDYKGTCEERASTDLYKDLEKWISRFDYGQLWKDCNHFATYVTEK